MYGEGSFSVALGNRRPDIRDFSIQLARSLGIKEAEVIRQAIDRQADALRPGLRDLAAWEREKAFIAQQMAAGPVQDRRLWQREDAYRERLERYGRKDHG